MILLGLDCETTGLDHQNDRITELGLVLWDTDSETPLAMESIMVSDPNMPELTPEIQRLTGLTNDMIARFGQPPQSALNQINVWAMQCKIDYIVAHNGENFDKPFLISEFARHGIDTHLLNRIPWIDTKTDLIFENEPDSRRLRHLALDCGFINPFEHRAIFDVLTMLKVLSFQDLTKVIEYQKIPFITVRALVSYEERELAKAQRFSWEKLGDKTYTKSWVKRIKEDKFEAEQAACKGFKIVRLD